MAAGNTLCTEEQFDNVVRAIAEFAFVISELPVVLSLEVTPESTIVCGPPALHVWS
jgi:hypothetical protein